MKKRIIFVGLAISLLSSCGGDGKEGRTKRELATLVVEEAGFAEAVDESVSSSLKVWKKSMPHVSEHVWETDLSGAIARYRKRMLNAHISAYAEGLSKNELEDLLEFYRSPPGRKLTRLSRRLEPVLISKSFAASEAFNGDVQEVLSRKGPHEQGLGGKPGAMEK